MCTYFRYELQVIPKYQRIGRLSTIWAIATGIHEHMVRLVSLSTFIVSNFVTLAKIAHAVTRAHMVQRHTSGYNRLLLRVSQWYRTLVDKPRTIQHKNAKTPFLSTECNSCKTQNVGSFYRACGSYVPIKAHVTKIQTDSTFGVVCADTLYMSSSLPCNTPLCRRVAS